MNEIRFCYEQQLQGHPDLEGRTVVAFTIGPDGSVTAASVESSSLADGVVEQCVARAVARIPFPAPEPTGLVVVRYPFLFQSS